MLENIISYIQSYVPLFALLAGAFVGDSLIILGILSGSGNANFFIVFSLAMFGSLFHDIIFYYLVNTSLIQKLKKKILNKKRNSKLEKLTHFSKRKRFLLFYLASRYVYGIRDLTVISYATVEKRFSHYLVKTFIVTSIWLFSIIGSGWLIGKGFVGLLNIVNGAEKIVLIIVLVIISFFILEKLIRIVLKKIYK